MLLHANRLTGSIPRELGNLTELGNLILSQNRLTGQIPHTLARFEDTINPQQGDEYLPVETAVPALPILAALLLGGGLWFMGRRRIARDDRSA